MSDDTTLNAEQTANLREHLNRGNVSAIPMALALLAKYEALRAEVERLTRDIQEIREGRHAVNDALVWHKRRADAAEAEVERLRTEVEKWKRMYYANRLR